MRAMGERRPERSFGASSGRSVQFGAVSSLTSDIDSATLSRVGRWWANVMDSAHSAASCYGEARTLCGAMAVSGLFAGTGTTRSTRCPCGGAIKICETSCDTLSTGRTLWCRCGFFGHRL